MCFLFAIQVTVGYGQEDPNRQHKQILQQHDLLGTQFSPGTKRKAFLLGQVKTVIAAQMTALLQLTDIMSAAKAKKIVKTSRNEVKRLLRRKAIDEREKPSYKCGKRELLWICSKIGEEMESWQWNGSLAPGGGGQTPSVRVRYGLLCVLQRSR